MSDQSQQTAVVFAQVKEAVKRVFDCLSSDSAEMPDRVNFIRSWRSESWTWLYSHPDLAFDYETKSYPSFKAFEDEIDKNSDAPESHEKQVYFQQLGRFYKRDLHALLPLVELQLTNIIEDIEKLQQVEPNLTAAGRPELIRPESLGPKAYKQAFDEHKLKVEEWRSTPVGKDIEQKHDIWQQKLRKLAEYRGLLLGLQNDLTKIEGVCKAGISNPESVNPNRPGDGLQADSPSQDGKPLTLFIKESKREEVKRQLSFDLDEANKDRLSKLIDIRLPDGKIHTKIQAKYLADYFRQVYDAQDINDTDYSKDYVGNWLAYWFVKETGRSHDAKSFIDYLQVRKGNKKLSMEKMPGRIYYKK